MELAHHAPPGPAEMLRRIDGLRSRDDWGAIVALADRLPSELDAAWEPVAGEIAFALGQRKRFGEAIAILERCFAIVPAPRRASALAYLHYAALLEAASPERRRGAWGDRGRGERDAHGRETLEKGFRRWIGVALDLSPASIKDLYRLGVFEAQIESAHDKVALRAFLAAIRAFEALPGDEREARGDLRKAYVRSLYAAARSALRLGQAPLARRLSFACVREDQDRDYLEPVHKLGQAAKVCLATGEIDLAERAARKAIDAKGPPRRDHLYGVLTEVARRRGLHDDGVTWIERNVPAHRRSAALFRQLGDLHRDAGRADAALAAWRSSLDRDRAGKHLTLVRIGRLLRAQGQLKEAERALRDALDFRRRKYLSDDPAALGELAALLETRGRIDEARQVGLRLARCGKPAEARREGVA